MRLEMLTAEQEDAHGALVRAIRREVDNGNLVPCTVDPAGWDDQAAPADCERCPLRVFDACDRYLLTGAVQHPTVMAGQRIKQDRRLRNNRKAAA